MPDEEPQEVLVDPFHVEQDAPPLEQTTPGALAAENPAPDTIPAPAPHPDTLSEAAGFPSPRRCPE